MDPLLGVLCALALQTALLRLPRSDIMPWTSSAPLLNEAGHVFIALQQLPRRQGSWQEDCATRAAPHDEVHGNKTKEIFLWQKLCCCMETEGADRCCCTTGLTGL